MTEKLQQLIKDELAQLPKEGQEVINASGWIKITGEIAKSSNLNEDELSDLQTETLLVLIGVTDPKFYEINIENQVSLTTEMSKEITKQIFERVFIPIRRTLEENIKKTLKERSQTWDQNIEFILSGGDYTAFIEKL